ncbi:hypothetical protein PLESTF_001566400 [Pleodorina starrii]|nr:hypothetical protein PLESTF_001566400 [Pleodorina starrii]
MEGGRERDGEGETERERRRGRDREGAYTSHAHKARAGRAVGAAEKGGGAPGCGSAWLPAFLHHAWLPACLLCKLGGVSAVGLGNKIDVGPVEAEAEEKAVGLGA